jgi:hypothetical protein
MARVDVWLTLQKTFRSVLARLLLVSFCVGNGTLAHAGSTFLQADFATVEMPTPVVSIGTMKPLDDDSMAAIDGRSGIQLTLRLRNNVSDTGAPIGCSGTPNPCRFGLEFADRAGIWLMMKDYYGSFSINDIRLEGTTLPAVYTGYQDSTRFLANDLSTCLIAGCDPRGQQALNIFYPGNKGAGVYNDLTFFVNVGRVALEFDDGATPGFQRDAATGSVFGFRAADSAALNAPNRARIEGNAYVYGF